MRAKTTIVLSIIVFVAMLCAVPVLGFDTSEAEIRAKLEAIVDKYIAICEAKSALLNSSSENIRRSAMISCLKSTYCRRHREALVKEMLENKIVPKPYKVRHFLSAKFYETVWAKIKKQS